MYRRIYSEDNFVSLSLGKSTFLWSCLLTMWLTGPAEVSICSTSECQVSTQGHKTNSDSILLASRKPYPFLSEFQQSWDTSIFSYSISNPKEVQMLFHFLVLPEKQEVGSIKARVLCIVGKHTTNRATSLALYSFSCTVLGGWFIITRDNFLPS